MDNYRREESDSGSVTREPTNRRLDDRAPGGAAHHQSMQPARLDTGQPRLPAAPCAPGDRRGAGFPRGSLPPPGPHRRPSSQGRALRRLHDGALLSGGAGRGRTHPRQAQEIPGQRQLSKARAGLVLRLGRPGGRGPQALGGDPFRAPGPPSRRDRSTGAGAMSTRHSRPRRPGGSTPPTPWSTSSTCFTPIASTSCPASTPGSPT